MRAAIAVTLTAVLLSGCKAEPRRDSYIDDLVAADNERLEQQNRIVCIKQRPIGSHIKRDMCLPYSVWIEMGRSLPPLTGLDAEPQR